MNILKKKINADIVYNSLKRINREFYCHDNNAEYVVFYGRINGDAETLANVYYKKLKKWISNQPNVVIEGESLEFTSICYTQNTRYGNKICRGINLMNENDQYDEDDNNTVSTLSASEILENQMKIVFILAIVVGVFVPIGIIGLIILSALTEAIRVWVKKLNNTGR